MGSIIDDEPTDPEELERYIEAHRAVQKYEHIEKLTPEIMHELIEKIVVHAPDKSSGKRIQQIDIYFRFDVAVSSVSTETGHYGRKIA